MRNFLTYFLLILFVFLISTTVIMIGIGSTFPLFMTPFTTLVGFSFTLLNASQRLGWKYSLILLGLSFVISQFFESQGVATGMVL